ncbi:hypothetical protein B0T18DRAFT_410086 [Schizothecium vesticola]|uniref:Uncharacterized protein n=1 Tax=Schizothecium vesticola TaxID=314040 RepID=A0AA40K4V9_9PEZI|nr:hypothetical protein B0T18DRAFT_410086 [Schizothecium vesticola]
MAGLPGRPLSRLRVGTQAKARRIWAAREQASKAKRKVGSRLEERWLLGGYLSGRQRRR